MNVRAHARVCLPLRLRRRCVEADRCAAAAEVGYAIGLFKVYDAHSMAKNDLLVGVATCTAPEHASDVLGKHAPRCLVDHQPSLDWPLVAERLLVQGLLHPPDVMLTC